MQAYLQQKWMQILDANKLLKVLDAASNSALKLFQVDAIIIKKQKKMQGYMLPNLQQILDAIHNKCLT